MKPIVIFGYLMLFFLTRAIYAGAQPAELDQYNLIWNRQSENSSESMPCGGGDIGLNVWVEKGDLLFYLSRSGTFDENNAFLKLGRVRVHLSPNPFEGAEFQQELHLREGFITVEGKKDDLSVEIKLWVDVFRPVIHVEVAANKKIDCEAVYESWRYRDLLLQKGESFANSYKWAPPQKLKTLADSIAFSENRVLFFHRNPEKTVFDVTVSQQGLDELKPQMFNPLDQLTFGGLMQGKNMIPAGTTEGKYLDTAFNGWKLKSRSASRAHELSIYLHTAQTQTTGFWKERLHAYIETAQSVTKTAFAETKNWWKQFWERSFVFILPDQQAEHSPVWQIGRNYQLFRYMLGCNAYGSYPTKFNGGMFTVDPVFTDSTKNYTPDFRNWGGGTFTAQNQRLVYFPMLKSADFDLMKPQFDFYKRILRNAELRSETYWGHQGACFTEQMENFGLPNCSEYGWERPVNFDQGVEYNAWLEYEWDTVLEFCSMILESYRYSKNDIGEYIPLIESCLTFFDEHYRYLAGRRGIKPLDASGHLVLYPGSACETYKMAYNSTSTIAALKTVLEQLLVLPGNYVDQEQREKWQAMQKRIPPIGFAEHAGHKTIAPAQHWERVNNVEVPQLYPVFPWGMYGVGKPDWEVALNTWKYDPDAIRFRSHVGWKQDLIFAARLGLTKEAAGLAIAKMKDSERRFPAFWGPGFDWVPDHNWGGSGMIGVQEMLMQIVDDQIYLFPAWPPEWDVHFKLHAPGNTTVEAELKDGQIRLLKVIPESRSADIIDCHHSKPLIHSFGP